jgi:colicin import membrane protein
MAGMIDANAVKAARAEGYSDDEIVSFLSQKSPGQFKEAQDAGYSAKDILEHLGGAPAKAAAPKGALEGLGTAARQGYAGMVGGVGETLKQTGLPGGDTLKAIASKAAPEQPVDTTVFKGGLHVENAPRFLAEQAAPTAAMIASGRLASRIPSVPGKLAGLLGGALAGGAMMFGNTAKDVAADRTGDPNAEPDASDKTRAALTTVPAALVGALGVPRFLPGAGKVVDTGLKGAGEAVKQFSLRTAENVAAGTASNLVEQTGKTIGTEKGLRIDTDQAVNAGIGSGLAAGALATPRAAADISTATKYRKFGGDDAAASARVANRIQQLAAGDERALSNPKAGHDAVMAAQAEIGTEIKSRTDALRAGVDTDTAHALDRAAAGKATKADLQTLNRLDAGTEQLARDAVVANRLLKTGIVANGKFKGGAAAHMERALRPIFNPLGAAAAGGVQAAIHGLAPSFSMYSIPALGGVYGAYLAALAGSKITGSRSPANRFVNKFADGQGVRPETVPPNPVDRGPVTGPRIAPAPPPPWGSPVPQQEAPDPRQLMAQVNALKVFREAAAKREKTEQRAMVRDTMPALRQLATQKAPEAPPAPPAATTDPRQLMLQIQALANSRRAALARKPDEAVRSEPVSTPAEVRPQPESTELPTDVAKNATKLVRGLARVAKLKATQEKATAKVADAEAKAKAKQDAAAAKEAAKVLKAARAFTSIKKSKGKVQETKPAPKVEEPAAFTPATDAELPFQFMDHGEAADAYFASRNKKPSDRERAAKIRGRTREESMIQKIVSKAKGEDNKETLRMVLEELHHNSSASYTKRMLDYYVAKLPKDIGDELRRAFSDDYIRRNKQPEAKA